MNVDKLLDYEKEDSARIEAVQKKQEEFKFVGSVRFHPGHALFSYNRKTGEIKEAEYEREVSVGMDGLPIYKRRVKIQADCYYDQALNQKNFIKRLKRDGIITE